MTPDEKGDLISREALREKVKTLFWSGSYKSTILQLIDNAPTVEPISVDEYRNKLIGLFHETGHDELITFICLPTENDYKILRDILLQYKFEPQGEITNEDIQQAMKEGFANGYEMAKAKFSPKQGEWVNREHCQVDEDRYEVANCINCGAEITLEYPYDNYCPNCGADMRPKQEEENT